MNNVKFKLGDRVVVRPGFGSEPAIEVTITGLDHKNGRPLVVYRDENGLTRWAYTAQIEEVFL